MADRHPSILAAADRLLARRGFRHMTIDDIAREAGVGKGTVYLYFASKEEVALAVIDEHIEATFSVLRALADADAPAAARLERMLVARVVERANRFWHYTEGLHDLLATLRPRLLAQRERQLDAEARIFADVLREIHPEGATPSVLHRVAHALLTGTNALLPYYLKPEELGGRAALARRAGDVARLLVRGTLAELGQHSARSRAPRRVREAV